MMSATLDDVYKLVVELRSEVAELKAGGARNSWRAGDVLFADDVMAELRIGRSRLDEMVAGKLIRPMPRKMPTGSGRGKRGGKLRFLYEEVQRAKGVASVGLGMG